jgi:hypothetical protein
MEIKLIDVDDEFIDSLWNKINFAGSFYSIGDGVTKDTFRRVMYASSYVLAIDGGVIRLEIGSDFVELHIIVFNHAAFRNPKGIMESIVSRLGSSFHDKPICCIIPSEMRGAKRLAILAGMTQEMHLVRQLSGVNIDCDVFMRRYNNV